MRFFGFKIKFLLWFSKNPYYHRSIVYSLRLTQISIFPRPRKRQSRLKKLSRTGWIIDHRRGATLARSPTWQVGLLYVAFTIHRAGQERARGTDAKTVVEGRSIYETCTSQWLSRIGGEKGISWNNEIAFLSRGHERNSIYTMIFLFLGNRDKPIPD